MLAFALMCAQSARSFLEGDFNLIDHRDGPVSRVSALVTSPGTISADDDVIVMPA